MKRKIPKKLLLGIVFIFLVGGPIVVFIPKTQPNKGLSTVKTIPSAYVDEKGRIHYLI